MSNRIFPLISDVPEVSVSLTADTTLTQSQISSSFISLSSNGNYTVTIPNGDFKGQMLVLSNDGFAWLSIDFSSYGDSHITDPFTLLVGKSASCVWNGKAWSVINIASTSGVEYGNMYFTAVTSTITTTGTLGNAAAIQPNYIISSNPTAAIQITLPSGTNIESIVPPNFKLAGFSWEFSIINTSTTANATITVAGNTGATLVGDTTAIPINGGKARYRVVRGNTANSFTVYRVG